MKVVIEITSWTQPLLDPIAAITETIGHAGDHETEMQAIIRSGGFSKAFPESVQKAAQEIFATKEQIFTDALKDPKRRDIRNVMTMTIDPVDAKDFDDAISFRYLDNENVEIGVHIADVSHYVRPDTILEQEAQKRATSVYLVDRVVPMLPERLSNDLCSLVPHKDRLTFGAVFEMTPSGKIVEEWFGRTVIHSDHRFAYEEAQVVLDGGEGPYGKELTTLNQLAHLLRDERFRKGAIGFESPEVKFVLDANGVPLSVIPKDRKDAHKLIEEFMLLANVAVAERLA
jgi:ribonuclease R